jgi:gamma-glutamylcyclotransferase (GGCT)/AIG2-like uncharacterized protein YtfP
LDASGDEVQGFLFSSDVLAEHLPHLDAFEGNGYERVKTPVQLVAGMVDAFIYVLSRPAVQN